MLNQSTKLITAVLITCSIIISCSEDEPQPVPEEEKGILEAEIDGVSWKSTQTAAVIMDDYLMISALAADGSLFRIRIEDYAAQTYPIEIVLEGNVSSIDKGSFIPENWGLGNLPYSSEKVSVNSIVGGLITITAFDLENNLVSGQFSIRMSRSQQNEDGTYPSPAQYDNISAEGSFNKVSVADTPAYTASARINGNTFTPTEAVQGFGGPLSISIRMATENERIMLTIPDNITEGSHLIDAGATPGWRHYDASYTANTKFYNNKGGTVTITKHDRLTSN